MIKVHFEILPHGSMADKYSMGWLQIINDGDEDEGNVLESLTEERTYTYLLFDNRGNLITFGGVTHNRRDGFWVLVQKVWEAIKLP